MTELMNEYGKRLFRFKGLVLTTSSDEFLVLQGVMGQLEPIEQTPRLNQATSRLVFIGQALDTEAIRAKILGLVKSR
jgi:G3E family GTPase